MGKLRKSNGEKISEDAIEEKCSYWILKQNWEDLFFLPSSELLDWNISLWDVDL